jgi:hypothetical protein
MELPSLVAFHPVKNIQKDFYQNNLTYKNKSQKY